jgi:spore maturation protein CgeB
MYYLIKAKTNMKILYIYRDYKGRRKKYGEMMEKCGHTVKYLQILEKKIKNQVHVKHIKKHNPDIVWILTPFYIQYKVLSDETISYLSEKNIPIVMYCTYNPDIPYTETMQVWEKIDYLFLQNYDMVKFLKKKGLNAHYVPLAFYKDQYFKTISKKKYDVSFMGNATTYVPLSEDYRSKYLQSLIKYNIRVFGNSFKKRLTGIQVSDYRGHEIQRQVYGQTKINLDIPFVNYKHDFYKYKIHWKNRSFEIPATGNFLLTIRCKECLDLFGEDTVGFYDANVYSLKENIDKYLRDSKLREEMSKRAYKLVHSNYTYLHMFKKMFSIINN